VHRKPLLDLLARYRALHPEEAACADRIRALVEAHRDCLERTCLPGHVTGSAWVLSPDRRRFLLVHHRKLGRWLQPGGHADGDPDLAAVALREAHEETGLADLAPWPEPGGLFPFDLDVHAIPERAGESAHEHHDVRFVLVARAEREPRASHESHAVRWFAMDDLERLGLEESVLRMGRKARARIAAADREGAAP
jgi:8-oxo-dGTP pyrophosphatase MutT (NUDIX family)